MTSSEVAPFVKVGGLADVVGALAKALNSVGHDVRIVCPLYGCIRRDASWKVHDGVLVVRTGDHHRYGKVWETTLPGSTVPIYFIEHDQYFHRYEVYTGPWGSHQDNGERFTYLSRAGIDICYFLSWFPDVVHAHDWPTGFVPAILNTTESQGPLGGTPSVLTIHNLEHQGVFHENVFRMAGLPEWCFRADGYESMDFVNMLKGGIFHASKVTTVSPTYAREIQESVGGCGLHDVLRFKSADLVGILNGIDPDVWSPARDDLIPEKYSAKDLSGKRVCKAELQRTFNLEFDETIPIFGTISRLAHQKGLDLLKEVIPWALETMRVQFVILGAGEEDLQWALGGMPAKYPGRVGAFIGFNNHLAHLIEAGSDFFLMPSRFEPCGLNQMYSQAYGTPPIARATGGLIDSIRQYSEGHDGGTGFLFGDATVHSLYYTIGWACATYYDRPKEYRNLQLRGMETDFSWNTALKKYEDVYKWAIQSKGRPVPI